MSASTRWHLAALAGALLVVAACCSTPVPMMEAGPTEGPLTIEDDGRTIDLRVGDRLAIRLEASPGAGFAWTIVGDVPEVVEVANESPPFEACPGHETRDSVGGPSCQTFRLEATKAGAGRLQLAYARPWEKAKPPAKTFTVKLRVR